MYCSTCGARIPTGRRACDTCGTPLLAVPRSPMGGAATVAAVAHPCPRCGYDGPSVGYFSRSSRLAALVGVTMLTAGVMGAGGLIYYLVRKDHLVCARCGYSWGALGERALLRGRAPRLALPTPAADPEVEADGPGGARESALRTVSILLFVLAMMLVISGIIGGAVAPVLVGASAAGGAVFLRRAAQQAREERRAALIAALQGPVLRLAAERGGSLTVTEVAAQLGWTIPRAEKVLRSLDDGERVDSEVTDEGVIVYRFLELTASRRLAEPGA